MISSQYRCEHQPLGTQRRRGFSLLEMTITLGVAGTVMAGIWQLLGTSSQIREASALASQSLALSGASQQYINGQRTSLLALPGLASLNSVVRVKIQDSDTGDTATSVQGAGYLPGGFVNQNSYGQSYNLYVRREDGGTLGIADSSDRLVGLLISTGGTAIADPMGSRIAGILGAPGGFLYREENPAPPTAATTARGSHGGWVVDLTAAGWVGIGATATAGRLALLTNLTPTNVSGSGGLGSGGGGAGSIAELEDGATDYPAGNLFLGQDAGAGVSSGQYNTATGLEALSAVDAGSYNTAYGAHALDANTAAGNTALGAYALPSVTTASGNTAVGASALYSLTTGGNGNTAVGYESLYSNNSQYNTALGYQALRATTAHNNVAVGHEALLANVGGDNNTAIGTGAGSNLTAGSYNILIGSGATAPATTGSNQLNIGNYIYGNVSTKQLNLGSSTLVSGIAFDVGSATTSARLAVGTTAQRPTCNASLEGAMRWNSQTQNLEVCTASAWVQPTPAWTSVSGTPPTPNVGSGFFVMTETTYDGNLGGLAGANAKCLTELTTKTNWMGYATALANGQLVADKVKAWLCPSTSSVACQEGVPLTTYYFARVGDSSVGGANFTTASTGRGPNNTLSWSAYNYFNWSNRYWANRTPGSDSVWQDGGYNVTAPCSTWTSNSAALTGRTGIATGDGSDRFQFDSATCDTQLQLICFVHP